MHPFWAFNQLHQMLTTRAAVVPVTAGAVCGLACAVLRGRIGRFSLGSSDARSLMNFSSNGSLHCVCGTQHPESLLADRRQFCRSCGCEIVVQDHALLDKQLTPKEIKAITRSLRLASIRASQLELPPSITTVEELHRYLALSDSTPRRRTAPPPSSSVVEQPTVH
jgi:hypothetical protein